MAAIAATTFTIAPTTASAQWTPAVQVSFCAHLALMPGLDVIFGCPQLAPRRIVVVPPPPPPHVVYVRPAPVPPRVIYVPARPAHREVIIEHHDHGKHKKWDKRGKKKHKGNH